MAITLISSNHFKGNSNITPSNDADRRDLADIVREAQTAINTNETASGTYYLGNDQITAADADTIVLIAPADGTITAVSAVAGTTAAAGEDMSIDVTVGGTTALDSAITLDATAGTDVQDATLAADPSFSAGDVIVVARDYTAGGTPTPMTNTFVQITYTV